MNGVLVRRVPSLVPGRLLFGRPVLKAWEIMRDLKVAPPDVLHLHAMACLGNDYVALAAKIPMVLTGHGPGFSFRRRSIPLYIFWKGYLELVGKKVLRRAGCIVAVTPHELVYWKKWGVGDDKLRVVPWGVSEDCFGSYDGQRFRDDHRISGPLLLFAGALHPSKGPQHLLRILPRVLEQFPSAVAVLCGPDAGYGSYLRSVAKNLGIDKHVRFLGYVDRSTLLSAYAACDLFVLPSNYEAFGLVLGEALAFGKPIVASRVGGVPFVVEDAGLLVEPGSIEDLQHKVLTMLGDRSLRENLASRARDIGARYSWKAVVREYEEIYEHCRDQWIRCNRPGARFAVEAF
jgi:glycosyltransferase involved in cell wall biosynthesis